MNTFLMTVSSAVGTVIALGLSGTMLAVALTVVRRNRPEGVVPIATSAVISLVSAVVTPLAYMVVPVLESRMSSSDQTMVYFAAVGMGATLLHTMAGVLLIVGILKMAGEGTGRVPL